MNGKKKIKRCIRTESLRETTPQHQTNKNTNENEAEKSELRIKINNRNQIGKSQFRMEIENTYQRSSTINYYYKPFLPIVNKRKITIVTLCRFRSLFLFSFGYHPKNVPI